VDVTQALKDAENGLRDFIASTLSSKYGQTWVDSCGVGPDRVAKWRERRTAELSHGGTASVDERLLYYADFYDLDTILRKSWPLFSDALGDRKTFAILLKELGRLRNPDAHRRELLPHQKHLALGISGEIRTRIVRYRSRKETSSDCFPRIESAIDSYGNQWTPSPHCPKCVLTGMSLRPGDLIEFIVTARDPEDLILSYSLSIGGALTAWQSAPNFSLRLSEEHIREELRVFLRVRSPREYHAAGTFDDQVFFQYSVLPPKAATTGVA
jgi:hypothetical protein